MRRGLFWTAVLAGWTVLAVVYAVSSSLTYAISYRPPRWGLTFVFALTEWYAWALLTPAVAWLASRLRLSRHAWLRRTLMLAAIGLPVAVLKVSLTRYVRELAGIREYFLLSNLATHYLIYWGIVAIVHVQIYYRGERERELRASQAEARLAEAKLQLLRMQLHPHFLFNTLNAVAELVHENPAAAERMITGLSHLLRETLDAGAVDLVPLARELELTERYLEIARTRFGDRLDARILPPDAGATQALVPMFLLQPLVENAIKHGIGARRGSGTIVVRTRRDGERLELVVEDDGPGFGAAPQDGIGLTITRERLQTIYPGSHRLQTDASSTGGGRVAITIPFRTDAVTV